MKKAGDSSTEVVEESDYDMDGITIQARKKRSAGEKGTFEPANSACECDEEDGSNECEEKSTEKPSSDNDMCICAFDRQTNDAWPCHRRVGRFRPSSSAYSLFCKRELQKKRQQIFLGAMDKYNMSNMWWALFMQQES